jgi:hypothetical protein
MRIYEEKKKRDDLYVYAITFFFNSDNAPLDLFLKQ